MTVEQSRLYAFNGVFADYLFGFLGFYLWKLGCSVVKRNCRKLDPGNYRSTQIFSFSETQSKVVAVPRSTTITLPPNLS